MAKYSVLRHLATLSRTWCTKQRLKKLSQQRKSLRGKMQHYESCAEQWRPRWMTCACVQVWYDVCVRASSIAPASCPSVCERERASRLAKMTKRETRHGQSTKQLRKCVPSFRNTTKTVTVRRSHTE